MEMSEVRLGDVYCVMLNPTRGDEIRNMRPCLVLSQGHLPLHPVIPSSAAVL